MRIDFLGMRTDRCSAYHAVYVTPYFTGCDLCPLGSRSAVVNMEAKGAVSTMISRRCVIVKWAELTSETLLDLVNKGAGAVLVLLPRELSAVEEDEMQVGVASLAVVTPWLQCVAWILSPFRCGGNWNRTCSPLRSWFQSTLPTRTIRLWRCTTTPAVGQRWRETALWQPVSGTVSFQNCMEIGNSGLGMKL